MIIDIKESYTLHVWWCPGIPASDYWEIVDGYLQRPSGSSNFNFSGTYYECKRRLLDYDYYDLEYDLTLNAFQDYLKYS
jgi:hypothetical protein